MAGAGGGAGDATAAAAGSEELVPARGRMRGGGGYDTRLAPVEGGLARKEDEA